MSLPPLEHPAGQIPATAPQGLVDILWPAPASMAQHIGEILTQHGTGLWPWALIMPVLILLALPLSYRFWRDRRGIILRWRLGRLLQLMNRPTAAAYTPDQLSMAAMWALARYFGMRPALQRPLLPAHWQPLMRQFDALRFGPNPASPEDLQTLLRAMQAKSRQSPAETSC